MSFSGLARPHLQQGAGWRADLPAPPDMRLTSRPCGTDRRQL